MNIPAAPTRPWEKKKVTPPECRLIFLYSYLPLLTVYDSFIWRINLRMIMWRMNCPSDSEKWNIFMITPTANMYLLTFSNSPSLLILLILTDKISLNNCSVSQWSSHTWGWCPAVSTRTTSLSITPTWTASTPASGPVKAAQSESEQNIFILPCRSQLEVRGLPSGSGSLHGGWDCCSHCPVHWQQSWLEMDDLYD